MQQVAGNAFLRAHLDHVLQFLLVMLVLRPLEGVRSHQHDVKHDPTRPDVGNLRPGCSKSPATVHCRQAGHVVHATQASASTVSACCTARGAQQQRRLGILPYNVENQHLILTSGRGAAGTLPS